MVAPPPTHHSSVPPPSLMPPGTRLGRYEIIGELGTGGMATVYEGRALSVGGFSRRVAIKYLHPHLLRDEQFVQMFMDEGRLAAQIHHPNVVAVLDLVHEPDRMYMVSEYVEGDQLLGLFKNAQAVGARIPAPVALRIMLDALGGLHAAHELCADDGTPLRIVHRDVSPHNILVGSDGITRILDFGIAKAEERISTTRDGIVKGKLSYMAPEQPDEDVPVDRRADIFSAATVLWECLTGQRLFPGRTDREVLQALLHKPIPRLRSAAPELPEVLDEVLARGLARDPDQRYTLAAEFAEALEEAAGAVGIATPREVAGYVERNAARKLGAERERRRRMTTKDIPVYKANGSTPARPVTATRSTQPPPLPATRTEPGVGPAAGTDEAPTMLSAPHAIGRLRAGGAPMLDEPEPETLLQRAATPAAPVVAAPAVHAPALPALPKSPIELVKPAAVAPPPPRREPARSRVAWLPVLVVLLGVVLGYGIWTLMRPEAPRPVARAPESVAPRTDTTTSTLASPPVVAPPVAVSPEVMPTPPVAPTPAVVLAPPPRPAPVERAPRPPSARPVVARPRVEPTPASVERAPAPPRPAPSAAPTPPATPSPPAVPRLPRAI